MAFGVASPSLSKPFIPLPTLSHKSIQALFLPLDRHTSQASSITATRASHHMKLLCPINALFFHHAAKCIMGTTFHIWLNLFYGKNDRVIYGYWMGPDLEDGWGFVEAAIDQLYSSV